RTHHLQIGLERLDIGFRRHRTVPGDRGVEIERERALEGPAPIDEAAALRVIDVDVHATRLARLVASAKPSTEKQVARVDHAKLREVDDRVAARVSTSEVV